MDIPLHSIPLLYFIVYHYSGPWPVPKKRTSKKTNKVYEISDFIYSIKFEILNYRQYILFIDDILLVLRLLCSLLNSGYLDVYLGVLHWLSCCISWLFAFSCRLGVSARIKYNIFIFCFLWFLKNLFRLFKNSIYLFYWYLYFILADGGDLQEIA